MGLLCYFGLHWRRYKPTARPGTVVGRCIYCGRPKVKHGRPAGRVAAPAKGSSADTPPAGPQGSE